MPLVRSTMQPGIEQDISDAEYERWLDLGIVYDGTPPVEPADAFDVRVAARLADEGSQTRSAFDSIYVGVVDADVAPIVTDPASQTSTALRAAFGAGSDVAPADLSATWLSRKYAHLRMPAGVGGRTQQLAGPTTWGSPTVVQEPQVWEHNGTWYLIYSGASMLGLCTAPGPMGPWTRVGTQQVIGGGNGGEPSTAYHSGIYIDEAAGFLYVTYTNDTEIKLARATLADPTTFTNLGVIFNLPDGTSQFGNSMIVKDGSTFYLFYESNPGNWQSGWATADTVEGPYTNVVTWMDPSIYPPGVSNLSNMWMVKEDGRWVAYFHGGPGPGTDGHPITDIYRATSPDLVNWTVDFNGQPLIGRLARQEVDQVADACLAVDEHGNKWIYWSAYDNSRPVAYVMGAPLLPSPVRHDGVSWRQVEADGDTSRGIQVPQRPRVELLTVDQEITNVYADYTTVLSAAFTPRGQRVAVGVKCQFTMPAGLESAYFRATCSGGAPVANAGMMGSGGTYNGGHQAAFNGDMVFRDLTPGVEYTFNVQVCVGAGTWLCRPATFARHESLSIRVEDALYP